MKTTIAPHQQCLSRRDILRASLGGLAAAGLAPLPAAAAHIELNYAFWPFGDEIIADNARIFTEQYGVKVNLEPTSGEYAAVIETKLVSGTHLDLFRAQRGQAARWFAAEWIRPIDDMPNLDKITWQAFPGIGEGS